LIYIFSSAQASYIFVKHSFISTFGFYSWREFWLWTGSS